MLMVQDVVGVQRMRCVRHYEVGVMRMVMRSHGTRRVSSRDYFR